MWSCRSICARTASSSIVLKKLYCYILTCICFCIKAYSYCLSCKSSCPFYFLTKYCSRSCSISRSNNCTSIIYRIVWNICLPDCKCLLRQSYPSASLKISSPSITGISNCSKACSSLPNLKITINNCISSCSCSGSSYSSCSSCSSSRARCRPSRPP